MIPLPPSTIPRGYWSDVVLAPDGRSLVVEAVDSTGSPTLWIRALNSDVMRELPGTESCQMPFWSPDGKYVAYFDFDSGTLFKVAIDGGTPGRICDARNGRGGTWNQKGTIVFAPASSGPLMRVSAGGGEVTAVTVLDTARGQTAHRFPVFLPDGDHFLFSALPSASGLWDIYLGSLSSKSIKRILSAGSTPVYAEPGFLVFERDGRVVAQRFDKQRLELEGDPVALCTAPFRSDLDAEPVASVSSNGHLTTLSSVPPNAQLRIMESSGRLGPPISLPAAPWQVLDLTPDDDRALLHQGGAIWVLDLARGVPMRLAVTTASNPTAVWAPDGQRVAFVSKQAGREEVHVIGLDGRVEVIPSNEDAFKMVSDWSADGRHVLFMSLNVRTAWDLWMLPMDGDRNAVPYLRGVEFEMGARVSPDGRWLAYSSNETGTIETYVQSFPVPGRKVRISLDSGGGPNWSSVRQELRYGRGSSQFTVPYESGESFRPGTPRPLREGPRGVTGGAGFRDGERVLFSIAEDSRPPEIRLILNWHGLFAKK